jgi:hypothetical protein
MLEQCIKTLRFTTCFTTFCLHPKETAHTLNNAPVIAHPHTESRCQRVSNIIWIMPCQEKFCVTLAGFLTALCLCLVATIFFPGRLPYFHWFESISNDAHLQVLCCKAKSRDIELPDIQIMGIAAMLHAAELRNKGPPSLLSPPLLLL